MKRIPLNKKNVSRIHNKSGLYKIYNDYGTLVYVGTSKVMRHRLQSYYQKDDFTVNRTKRFLRPEARNFTYSYMGIGQARKEETRLRQTLKPRYNF